MTTKLTRRINRGGGHSYQLDGNKVDGVTTIIGNGIPKPALIAWGPRVQAEFTGERLDIDPDTGTVRADRLVKALQELGRSNRYNKWPEDGSISRLALIETLKGVHWEDRDAAARRGTEVHTLAERLIHDEEIDVPEELAGHVDSYIRFLDDWHVKPVLVEAVIINRTHRYMGTIDMVCDMSDGLRRLCDIKTTRSGIYPETSLQLAAYRNAETYLDGNDQEHPMPKVDSCAAIWVRADGYDVIPVDAGPEQFRMFRHAQKIAEFQTTTGTQTIGEAIQPRNGDQ